MKKAHFSNRGQALIIFVFALIGLIGITGLAIDGTNTLSERRRVQNGADTAAMAGALAKINGQKEFSWTNANCVVPNPLPADINTLPACAKKLYFDARDRATSNGYDGLAGSLNTVEVYLPP